MLHNNVYNVKRFEVSKPSVKYAPFVFPLPVLNVGLNTVVLCRNCVVRSTADSHAIKKVLDRYC